jgi:uncharacterized Zn-binding protein involved in type VI secretion
MPSVSRKGDTVMSKDGYGYKCRVPGETSIDEGNNKQVKANGILIAVQGNKIASHTKANPQCATDVSTVTTYSSKVRINGKGVARIGDRMTDDTATNTITQGSPNVFAGG